ncbi:L37A2 protein, partial [Corythaixoides concolor]|nr:L37A2 protein [Corythaixoides concolor]
IENYSDAVEQTKKTDGMEDAEDVEDAEEAPSPRQDYVWPYRKHKQGDSPHLRNIDQLFHKMFSNVNPEEEPTPAESKAEQRVNTNQRFFYNPLVDNSMLEDTAEEEGGSSPGGHLPAVPQSAETHWKQQKEEPGFLNKAGSSDGPDGTSDQGDHFETEVDRYLHFLVPDEALWTSSSFIVHAAQALRMDCSVPKLRLACAKLISKMGLLIKLLRDRRDDQGASALDNQCLLERNISNGTASGTKPTAKQKAKRTSGGTLLLAVSVSLILVFNLTAICLVEVCSQKPTAASQPQSTRKSSPKW